MPSPEETGKSGSPLKIGVVGCGALGSFYAACLCRAGHEVHCLLRSDYDVVSAQGFRVESVQGDFQVTPHCARRAEEIGVCDLVIIGLKTTANGEFSRLVPPLVGQHTAVLTLQNGLGNEAALAKALGSPDNVFGGLCFVCLNRTAPGVIQHSAHGLIVLGECQRGPSSRVRSLASLFEAASIPTRIADDLERAHWEKLIWNIPFNGLGVGGVAGYEAVCSGHLPETFAPGRCLTTDLLLDGGGWERLVRALMREVIDAARALGYPLDHSLVEANIDRTRTMGAYRASTLVDFERGAALELDGLFAEPLRRARAAGITTPRLASLTAVLTALDRRRAKTNQAD